MLIPPLPSGDPPGGGGVRPNWGKQILFKSTGGITREIPSTGESCLHLEKWLPCVFQGLLLFINPWASQSFRDPNMATSCFCFCFAF